MRIAEAFCKMRLSEYCSAQDIDRAIAVTVDSFVGSQKVSCKKALSRAFAKYVLLGLSAQGSSMLIFLLSDTLCPDLSPSRSVVQASRFPTLICRGLCPLRGNSFEKKGFMFPCESYTILLHFMCPAFISRRLFFGGVIHDMLMNGKSMNTILRTILARFSPVFQSRWHILHTVLVYLIVRRV